MKTGYAPQSEGWMSPPELDWLFQQAVATMPLGGFVLELGVWKGLSTSALTIAGPVICVDNWRGNPNEPWSTYEDFLRNMDALERRDRCIVLSMNTVDALRALKGTPVRLGLVDASHSATDAFADLSLVWSLLVPGGVVVADDRDWVKDAIQEFEARAHVKFQNVEVSQKLAWARKP